jgi:flagellar biogenesis protein FliO
MPPGSIISLILIVVFIFGLFYLRAYILKKASGQSWGRLGTKNIVVLERFAIAKDKTFCLTEVGGKVYFVIFTNNTVTLIDSYDAAAFTEAAAVQFDKYNSAAGSTPGTILKIPTGNSPYARATRSLARFIAAKTGRSASFEEQLAAAIKDEESKKRGD